MSIKCIALDLDRTTLEKDKTLSWGNRMAILDMIKRGIHVVIASGRPFGSLPKEVLEIPGITYAITSNGAAVYDIPAKKRIHEYLIPVIALDGILEIARENDLIMEAFVDGAAFADARYVNDPRAHGASEIAVKYILSTRTPVEDMEAFLREHCSEIDSIDYVIHDPEKKKAMLDKLKKVDGIYITSSISELIEISHKDAGKHSGMQFLMEKLGLKREEIAAFGDADNDIDMLDFAGTGIAVGNASPSCKEQASFVTKAYDEDGVAYAFYHYLDLPERKESVLKKRIAVHISSLTGNTRKVAQGIVEYLKARGHAVEVFESEEEAGNRILWENISEYDVHIVCFWCRKSGFDDASMRVIDRMKDCHVLIIGTLGYYPTGEYADHVKENVSGYVNRNNIADGVFLCQGKIAEARTEKRRSLPKDDPHYLNDEGYRRHLEARKHPDKQDIYNAIRFLNSYDL